MRALTKVFLIVACPLMGGLIFFAADQPDGAALYKQRCAMCHAADGKGYSALKTPDMTDPKWQAANKDDAIFEAIKKGKKGTAMMAFDTKLKDEEIRAVVAHIRTLNSSSKKK